MMMTKKTKIADRFRLAWRGVAFALILADAAWRYFWGVRGCADPRVRAHWLHVSCRRQLRVQNVHVTVRGPLPRRGLIVANHLTYLDIVALSAALPCVFVSKKEVAEWPIFGVFARLSGTLFLDRERRRELGSAAAQLRDALARELPVVLFPEGTSTHGDEILPFKTPLFASVEELGCPVTAAALRYAVSDGSVRDEVHCWGGMTLLPHLLNVFGKRRIDVTISFGEPRPRHGDRKTIARELHAEVTAIRRAP